MAAIEPARTDEERLEIRRLAQAGRFHGTPVFQILREWEALLEEKYADDVPFFTPEQHAELAAKEKALELKHGALIGLKVLNRDAAFFREMASCLEAIPMSDDQSNLAIDPVLEALARSPELVGPGPYVISQLCDYLRQWYGLMPDQREVREKARLCGLVIASS